MLDNLAFSDLPLHEIQRIDATYLAQFVRLAQLTIEYLLWKQNGTAQQLTVVTAQHTETSRQVDSKPRMS